MCMYIETEWFFSIWLIECNQKAWGGGQEALEITVSEKKKSCFGNSSQVPDIVLSLLYVSPQLLFITL